MSLRRWTPTVVTVAALVACGPGDVGEPTEDTGPRLDLGAPLDVAGVVGDPYNCGELGLTCKGPFGVGECIDDECQATLGHQCWSPEFAPSCDAYCEAFELTCIYRGCEGATAYGWMGTQWEADVACLSADIETVVPMAVACDQALDGIVTTVSCCCD